jgi:hypothetical protein
MDRETWSTARMLPKYLDTFLNSRKSEAFIEAASPGHVDVYMVEPVPSCTRFPIIKPSAHPVKNARKQTKRWD